MAVERAAIAGFILAGGQSRRMGGRDKSLIELAGTSLIKMAADRLNQQVDQLWLNANGDPARFGDLGLLVLPDLIDGYAGPLAGIHAGLSWARRNHLDITHLVSIAADTPFFPNNLVERLAAGAQASEIILAGSQGKPHPVFGLWPVSRLNDLTAFLTEQESRKILDFVYGQPNAIVEFAPLTSNGAEIDPFFNINTPQDRDIAADFIRKHHVGIPG